MKLFKRAKNLGESALTLRLWDFTGSAILNLVIFTLLAAYLLPFTYMLVASVKKPEPTSAGAMTPLYPAIDVTYHYQGVDYPVMEVPTEGGVKQWAIVTKRRAYSEFIDPQNPGRGLIHWDGYWGKLKKVFVFSMTFDAFFAWWSANLAQGMAWGPRFRWKY